MTTIENYYVIDTNALIWYLTNNPRLSNSASEIFRAAERGETRLIVSAIAIAELYYANQKNGFFADFAATYRQIRNKPYFRFVPVTADAILDFKRDASIPEMHDRIIVGLARRLNAPLLTSDSAITESGIVRVAW